MFNDREEWDALEDDILEQVYDHLDEGEEIRVGNAEGSMRYVRWQGRVRPATCTVKRVRARKARFEGTEQEIRPGDLVEVTTGFAYEPGGERLHYLPAQHRRVQKGEGW